MPLPRWDSDRLQEVVAETLADRASPMLLARLQACVKESPTEVEAMKLEGPNKYIFPMATTIAFRFPAREGMPPCEVRWYDGVKNKPPHPEQLDEKRKVPSCGKVIYGKDLEVGG